MMSPLFLKIGINVLFRHSAGTFSSLIILFREEKVPAEWRKSIYNSNKI